MDRRIKKTRNSLEKALLHFMKNKNITKISVKELCQYADVNRGTFYLHYNNIFDMLESIQNKILEEFKKDLSKYNDFNSNFNMGYLENLLIDIFNFFDKNSEICLTLSSENGDSIFESKLNEIVYNTMHPIRNRLEDEDKLFFHYYYSFFISGVTKIILEWLKTGKKESPKKMMSLTLNTMNLFNKIPK